MTPSPGCSHILNRLGADEASAVHMRGREALDSLLTREPRQLAALVDELEAGATDEIWANNEVSRATVGSVRHALGTHPDAAARGLIALARSSDDETRREALEALVEAPIQDEVLAAVLEAVGDSADRVRYSVARVLGNYVGRPLADEALDTLETDRDANVRAQALQSRYRSIEQRAGVESEDQPAAEVLEIFSPLSQSLRLLSPVAADDANGLIEQLRDVLIRLAEMLDDDDERAFVEEQIIPIVERLRALLTVHVVSSLDELRALGEEATWQYHLVQLGGEAVKAFVKGAATTAGAGAAVGIYALVGDLSPFVDLAMENVRIALRDS